MNNHVVPIDGTAKDVNEVISELKANKNFKAGDVSDGYHTFDELYEHRIAIYIALCRRVAKDDIRYNTWRTKKHSDGSSWDGWFILGIGDEPGEQITYHLPIEKWDECDFVWTTKDQAPDFDGHTSADVLKRISEL